MSRWMSVCLSFVLAVSAWGADPAGSITGSVTDPSGATVSAAKISVTAPATGLVRETVSTADGSYNIPLLPPGVYNLRAEATGFRTVEQRGITVSANAASTVPVTMQLGAVSESVTIVSDSELVNTVSGTLQTRVDRRNIEELPLAARNPATLVLLSPGTANLDAGNARGAGDTALQFRYPGGKSISSGGARADGVNYQVDGGSNRDPYLNVNNPIPNPDSLEEVSVQTNSFSAEHGNATGAAVNVVTKSGTNELHGSAFEFLRNQVFNSRNFFAPRRDQLKRNQFGGTLGGPIVANKLFYFGSYQGTIQRNIGGAATMVVPTAAERNGDFSARGTIIDPLTRQPFPNSQIPKDRFDPITLKLFPSIPLPTQGGGQYVFQRPDNHKENQVLGRVDYQLEKQRLYGRYFLAKYRIDPAMGTDTDMLIRATGFGYTNQGTSISHSYTLTPTLLNNFVFSYNRNDTDLLGGGTFTLADLGAKIVEPEDMTEIRLTVNGFFNIRTGRNAPVRRRSLQFSDSLHWMKGRHQIIAGGEVLRMGVNNLNTYKMGGFITFAPNVNFGSNNALADFMLGSANLFEQGGGEFGNRHYYSRTLFIQDNFRVSPSLMLNLGLRWDPFTPPIEEFRKAACYIPGAKSQRYPNSPVGYIFAGDPGCPEAGSVDRWGQFAPRVGFAYNQNGRSKMTVRGGIGLSFQPPFLESYNQISATAPFSPQMLLNRSTYGSVQMADPYGSAGVANPFPGAFGPANPGPEATFATPLQAKAYDTNWRPAQVWNWNLTVERQIASDMLARVGYVGSSGSQLSFNAEMNAAVRNVRVNRDFNSVVMNKAGSNSSYNALQISFEKRFKRGFSAGAHYTWSKSLDWNSFLSDLDSVHTINPFQYNAYRAVSDYNLPHRAVVNYVWELPSPESGWKKHLLGGWQTSGIWTWESGFPLSVLSGRDNSQSLIGQDMADVISTPQYTSGSRGDRIAKWFTTESFAQNAQGTFGTSGRNILQGPGTFNVDMSLVKSLYKSERWKAQYRAEFFNTFNHTLLSNPNTNMAAGVNFGRIQSARDPRIMQMALRFTF